MKRSTEVFSNMPVPETTAFTTAALDQHRERTAAMQKKWGEPLAAIAQEFANLLNIAKLLGHTGQQPIGTNIGNCISVHMNCLCELLPDLKARREEFQDDVLQLAHGLSYEREEGHKAN